MDPETYMGEDLVVADAESGSGLSGGSSEDFMQILMKSDSPIADLRKALSAGYDTTLASMTGGQALRMQSLEPDLKNLTFTEQSTVMANDLLQSKVEAGSTVEEYSTIDDISEAFTYVEGGLPSQEDDVYSRKFETVKFIGAVCQVTNVIMSVASRGKMMQNPVQRETRSKILAIKRKLNQLAYFGDKTTCATEFDGFFAKVLAGTPTNVIDCGGHRPSLEHFNEGVAKIQSVTGYTENLRLYISPDGRKNYKDELQQNKRYFVGGDQARQEVEGIKSNKLIYDGGECPMKVDKFLNPILSPRLLFSDQSTFIATGSTPPSVPTLSSITVGDDTASTLPAGTYDYALVATNQYGHLATPLTVGIDAVTVSTTGKKVTIVVTDSGSASGCTMTGAKLYRRANGLLTNSSFRYVGTYTGLSIVDKGEYMPDTSNMLLLEWDPTQVAAYHQLLDLVKFPLANVADSIKWLQRLYGVLMVYNTKKVVWYKNVGTTANS